MKKTIVFAIVLALVFAIAAPAFAEGATITSELNIVKEKTEFKYTEKGAEKAAKVELENVLVLSVKLSKDSNAASGVVLADFNSSELTYAGYTTGLFSMAAVNEPTVEAGKDGQVKVAYAGTDEMTDEGIILTVAFTFDAAAMVGKTTEVKVTCEELLNGEAEAIENTATGATYKFEAEAPVSEAPVSEAPVSEAPVSEAPVNSSEVVPSGSAVVVTPSGSATTPAKTGAASLAAVAVISVIAGLGAIALRKDA